VGATAEIYSLRRSDILGTIVLTAVISIASVYRAPEPGRK
jgi:hypothetical protein